MFSRDPDTCILFLIHYLPWMFKRHLKFHISKIELVIFLPESPLLQTFFYLTQWYCHSPSWLVQKPVSMYMFSIDETIIDWTTQYTSSAMWHLKEILSIHSWFNPWIWNPWTRRADCTSSSFFQTSRSRPLGSYSKIYFKYDHFFHGSFF